MNQAETLLEIKDLCVEFKTMAGTVRAVDHLSYSLKKGEKLGIVGESGSGKSVSSLAMMQLIPNPPGKVTGGRIFYRGNDLVQLSEREMQKIRGNEISMIFQEPDDFFKSHYSLWKADRRIFASAPGHEKERSHGGSNPHDGGSRHCQSGSSCL